MKEKKKILSEKIFLEAKKKFLKIFFLLFSFIKGLKYEEKEEKEIAE